MIRRITLTASCAAVLLTGCSADSEPTTVTGASGAFPVTIENCGQTVTVEAAPERIVSLNQGSTEVLAVIRASPARLSAYAKPGCNTQGGDRRLPRNGSSALVRLAM